MKNFAQGSQLRVLAFGGSLRADVSTLQLHRGKKKGAVEAGNGVKCK